MIKTQWLKQNGSCQEGDEAIIEHWLNSSGGYLWIDIDSEDPEHEKNLLLSLGIHPLAVEDAQRPRHPPKTEDFGDHVLILYRGIYDYDEQLNVHHTPIVLFVQKNCLISIHQGVSLGLQKHWNNINSEQLRQPALLATRIMRYSVGRYLEAIVTFEDRINELEDAMQEHPSDDIMRTVISYKSRLQKLKRTFNYHERIATILRRETPELLNQQSPDISHSLQDLFDSSERANSLAKMYYEMCGDLIEGYLSLSSHRLNNTMRVLTVITALFVPLTFLAGIYGMNFDNMPELHQRYGYFILLGVMGVLAASLLVLFRRLRWL